MVHNMRAAAEPSRQCQLQPMWGMATVGVDSVEAMGSADRKR
jgi:hypothetical protein